MIDEKPPAFIENLDRQLELDTCRMQLIILEKAYEGNAILYGRGGQYLLPGIRSVFRVRIIAPFEERVERWAEREWIDPDLAHSLVRKSDQRRAGYIKYYFDSDWENTINYDMIINTSRVSNDSAARLIKEATRDPYLIEKSEKCKVRIKRPHHSEKSADCSIGRRTDQGYLVQNRRSGLLRHSCRPRLQRRRAAGSN